MLELELDDGAFDAPSESVAPLPAKAVSMPKPDPVTRVPRLGNPSEAPSLEAMYRAVVGASNTDFYLRYFARRDAGGSFLSWNWPIVFVQFWWALYRKLWGFAFGGLLLSLLFGAVGGALYGVLHGPTGGDSSATVTGGQAVGAIAACFVAAFGNGFYHRKVRRLIAETAYITDPEQRLAELARRGGTSKVWYWVAILFFGVIVLGIVAAIAIPAYSDYVKRAKALEELKGRAPLLGAEPASPPPQAAESAPVNDPLESASATASPFRMSDIHGQWRCTSQETGNVYYWYYMANGKLWFYGETFGNREPISGLNVPTHWSIKGETLDWTYAQRGADFVTENTLQYLDGKHLRYRDSVGQMVVCGRP